MLVSLHEVLTTRCLCLCPWARAELHSHAGQSGRVLGQRALRGCLEYETLQPTSPDDPN